MKRTIQRRTINPPAGKKGKPRSGLKTKVIQRAESTDDLDEIAETTAPTYDPIKRLERLLEVAERVLIDLPGWAQKYKILDDNNWQALPDDADDFSAGLYSGSPLIAPLSPEDFAAQVQLWCKAAIAQIEKSDFEAALIPIMNAHEAFQELAFAEREYGLAGQLASTRAIKENHSVNHWAMPFASHLSNIDREDEKPAFKVAIRHLVQGDQSGLYGGCVVYYDAVAGTLSARHDQTGKTTASIGLESFRTRYYTKIG